MKAAVNILNLIIIFLSITSCSKSSEDAPKVLKILYSTTPGSTIQGEVVIRDFDSNIDQFVFIPDSTTIYATNADWYKRGEKIVFQKSRLTDFFIEIYTINLNGLGKQKIGECPFYPYLSPDGNKYLYQNLYHPNYPSNGDNHYYISSLDGSDKKIIIFDTPGYTIQDLSWSNSHTIIYVMHSISIGSSLHNYKICTVNTDGLPPKVIVESSNNDFIPICPQISPNGNDICYTVDNGRKLIICDIAGQNTKTIFSVQYGHAIINPHWMPDGQSIIFSFFDGYYSASTINIDGSNFKQHKNIRGINFKPAMTSR